MTERTTEADVMSSPCFENLEQWLRGKMQETLQALLEEEVTEFLGHMVAGDDHLGIWGALGNVYPEAEQQQRCWNHKMLNVLDKLPKRLHPAAKRLLNRIVYAPGQEQAEAAKREFQRWCQKQSQEPAAECLDHDWDRLITFYRFPQAHWRHLRTTNPIESPFAALQLRTDAARRYKKVERHCRPLEIAFGRGDEIPSAQRSRAAQRGLPGSSVC